MLLLLVIVGGLGAYFGLPYLEGTPEKMFVVPEDLHLWKKAQVNSGDLGEIPFGTEVTVIKNAGNGWQEVQWNTKKGYVNGYYLVPFEEFQIIKYAMDNGVKRWFDKSYLRISLAQYFHNEKLKADLPSKTFEAVYGESMAGKEVWSAKAKSFESEYNTVIKGMQLEAGEYNKDARQPDNVVILESKGKGGPQRKLVAFKHIKKGESYQSKVLAEMDITDYPGYEIRIAASNKLYGYSFAGRTTVLNDYGRGIQRILLANPRDDSNAILLGIGSNGKFEQTELTRF
jgi:hypothetical protein